MTPKQAVLRVYPDAYAYKWAGKSPWVIYSQFNLTGETLNVSDTTAAKAWAESAKRMKEKSHDQ